MNLYEFCETFKVSLGKARKMDKLGLLRLDGGDSKLASEMRHYMGRGQPLTAAQLCTLVEDPALLMDLNQYSERARLQLEELGNAKGEVAGRDVVAYISDAAKGDPEAIGVLISWLRNIIPADKPVNHSYIAVRLLLGLAPNMRQYDISRIPRAMLNCRRRAEFAGFWRTVANGSRKITIYQQPVRNFLDL